MEPKKSYIPIKVFVSYMLLAALAAGAGFMLYSENDFFSETENKIASENSKILKVTALLSNVYETESLARITIQSNSAEDFENYTRRTTSLGKQIDSLKLLVNSNYQVQLLDSVKILLSRKTENISKLKEIKSKASDEVRVKAAINDLTRMELSLRKLKLEDFVKNPSELGAYQRNVLTKYVEYLNQNIPNDSTNTLSQKALDSMLVASRVLLNDVKRETAQRNELLSSQEKALLENELSISEQLRKILTVIEREIIANTTKNNQEKEANLKNIIRIVTIAAVIGFILALLSVLLILNDFSKTQSYKKKLEIANQKTASLLKNREQLISTVSHDLKTPLSTIIGYNELLGQGNLNSKQEYYNNNIKGASEYISHLIQDLLDFTQIEAGKIVVENIPFQLPTIINDVVTGIQGPHLHKELSVQIRIDNELNRRIMGDPFRLKQILINIVGNAFKFTDEGLIKIDAETSSDKYLLIRISDSGIGIAKEHQQLIFEEFTQANNSIETKYGGTGLGLTISKKMADILGGSLTLESELGQGSTFTLKLPLKFDSSVISDPQFYPEKSKTVIVVDDDINLLNLTSEILRQNHYKALPFENAAEALEIMKSTSFDAVVTDIQMPEMDGFDFLANAIKMKQYQQQPFIAVTGKADVGMNAYRAAGFASIIKKPYSTIALVSVLKSVLNNNQFPIIADEPEFVAREFSLDMIKTFLPDDPNALKEMLQSFEVSTQDNMRLLSEAVSSDNSSDIRAIGHRMFPMFRQIGSNDIADALQDLENNNYSNEIAREIVEKLKQKTEYLFAEIRRQLII